MTSRVAAAILLTAALAGHEAASFAASIRAHACCARTKNACNRMGSPDDCCSRMGRLSARPITATETPAPDLGVRVSGSAIVLPSIASFTVALHSGDVSKRPHDPPYLHTFSLLI